ncbi:MAG: PhnD/SsuA/transferrin family substrate-binding protein [Lachnospiraceae bacterium]|jgi:NitT/TauT family transport system substrate-binding protein|nr:PhnD/SsuA/transferrin family substrate-binding protein [Lachnospiraceae bacterium]
MRKKCLVGIVALTLTFLAGCSAGGAATAQTAAETTAMETTAAQTTAAQSAAVDQTAPQASETAAAQAKSAASAATGTGAGETTAAGTGAASAGQDAAAAAGGLADESKAGADQVAGDAYITRVLALKGPTAMGMVKLMEDSDSGSLPQGTRVDISVVAAVDEVTATLVKGDADVAALPANLASVLYNNTKGQVKVLAVNTLGVLYIVENGDRIHSVADLKGKTIVTAGKGATPEYALNYILESNGLKVGQDVTLEFKSEHAECVAVLAATENAIAMLPQPFVTTAMLKDDKLRVALDLNEEWDKVSPDSALLTGVLVGRTEYIENEPEALGAFMEAYGQSVAYVSDDVVGAAALIGKYDIVPEAVAKIALPACNIVDITGEDMKQKLGGYLEVLYAQKPEAVGGQLPDDAFYFID